MNDLGADIAITGKNGWVAAIIVKNLKEFPRAEAEEYLRNIYSDGDQPPAKFFVILTQEKAFVWRTETGSMADLQYVTEIPTKEVFEQYLRSANLDGWLRPYELTPLAFDWLSRIAWGRGKVDSAAERELDRIGLTPAIRGATLTMAA